MSQDETFQILKDNPFTRFNAESVRQELRSKGIKINIQTTYSNLRRLAKGNLIKKEKRCYIYEPKGPDNNVETI